ncbi:cytidine deaminase [Suttonella sp. R2A3]|uniref:cytidine deaminase n=1 Tax=Suttonella sp. R2A3 TaxID=2908648 RepID=UPI001F18D469|nr:cytidine deaminase [Suttonella sp. R2A3]UJF24400.1 cytidine deaminase [Suttonella sp. R2A3]
MPSAQYDTFIPNHIIETICQDRDINPITYALSLLDQLKAYAVVPVSQFQVAAIAIDDAGHFYVGVNQEYAGAAMAQTVHAEQSAISHAWMRGATRIAHVVVNYPPCGHCRQFMNELRDADRLHVHLPSRQNTPFPELLPQDFSPADLGMKTRLLDQQRIPLTGNVNSLPPLSQAAIDAAEHSYAPYSGAYAGVALALKSGEIISGRYAENAAYNPSLPPLQAALNLLHLRGLGIDEVAEGVLAHIPNHGHAAHSKALWQAISKAPLHILDVTDPS